MNYLKQEIERKKKEIVGYKKSIRKAHSCYLDDEIDLKRYLQVKKNNETAIRETKKIIRLLQSTFLMRMKQILKKIKHTG